ncbi:hypothetical protein BCR36DRAFT_582396 [Piromyces finnis]|uniref:Uncharacterized protein n=1 Tax=Piromyces finnis TaxID=1754191 RepID=A0A1Y1VDZ2_9FUNG|nr:hypothetical protein BCR36DRAFT_582396 [Piromyces finnis]|eukprot:ORX52994.1 hypothetical protein BCR36DRAFT_582396 [Piromyces finnis]
MLYTQVENAISKYKTIWKSKKEGDIKDLSEEEITSLVKDICIEAEAKSFYSVTELASYKSTMSSRLLEAKKIVREDDIKDNNTILIILLDKLEKYKL